ncbi:MAG: Tail-specific protease [Bacteroidetes bacterium]|nr:MAG: Tail-specific protease [Bacteroidota bacterium]
MTLEQFYHLDKQTHQLTGVKPDIALEEPCLLADYRESFYEYALPCDSVIKNVVFTALPALPLKELASRSALRCGAGSAFGKLRLLNDSIRTFEKNRAIPFYPEKFYQYMSLQSRHYTAMGKCLESATPDYKAANHAYDVKLLEIDNGSGELNTQFLEFLQQDIYVDEAYRVMSDLLILLKN